MHRHSYPAEGFILNKWRDDIKVNVTKMCCDDVKWNGIGDGRC